MKRSSTKFMVLFILLICSGSKMLYAQSIRELFNLYNESNIILAYNNKNEGTSGEIEIEIYFTDGKNIMLFKLFDIYCLEINFTEGYIVPNSFDFEEFKIIEHGAKVYAYITIENNEIIIMPVRNRGVEIRIRKVKNISP